MSIDQTLKERGSRYGAFVDHARIAQNLKRALVDSPNWAGLPDDMKEALEMTVHKIGRILNGDPSYADSWHDIIGYVRLVEKRLEDRRAPVGTRLVLTPEAPERGPQHYGQATRAEGSGPELIYNNKAEEDQCVKEPRKWSWPCENENFPRLQCGPKGHTCNQLLPGLDSVDDAEGTYHGGCKR